VNIPAFPAFLQDRRAAPNGAIKLAGQELGLFKDNVW
jgi:hypothetical protein